MQKKLGVVGFFEIIQSHFTRTSYIKKKLEAIGDNVKEVKVEITNLNGLPSSWESFIQEIFSGRKLTFRGMHVRRNSINSNRRRDG